MDTENQREQNWDSDWNCPWVQAEKPTPKLVIVINGQLGKMGRIKIGWLWWEGERGGGGGRRGRTWAFTG